MKGGCIKKCLEIAAYLASMWRSSDFNGKQKLQALVFPEGIRYIKENKKVQTPRVNELFTLIQQQERVSGENKKGNLFKNCFKSDPVNLSSAKSNFLMEDLQSIIDY